MKLDKIGNHLVVDNLRNEHFGFLYSLLALRDPDANISHVRLPTWSEHCGHWALKAVCWQCRIVEHVDTEELIGYYYITDKDEIGVHVTDAARSMGYDADILGYVVRENKGKRLLANVSPRNGHWEVTLEEAGFTVLQTTMVKDC